MQPFNFANNPWFRKGLSLVLFLTLLSSGFIFIHSSAVKEWSRISLLQFNLPALGLACAALLVSWFVEGLRILLIAKALGETLSFRRILSINFVAAFAGNVTPFNAGGIPAQIYLLHQNGMKPGKAGAVVTIRVIISTLLFTIGAPFVMLVYYKSTPPGFLHQATAVAISLSVLLSVLLIAFIINPKLAQQLVTAVFKRLHLTRLGNKIQPKIDVFLEELEIFHQSVHEFRRGYYVYAVVFCSIAYWVLLFAIAPFLVLAFGVKRKGLFINSILIQFILVFLISYLPLPGGSGAMELGFYSALVFFPPHLKALFILVWRFLSYYVSTLVGGLIFLRIINRSNGSLKGEM